MAKLKTDGCLRPMIQYQDCMLAAQLPPLHKMRLDLSPGVSERLNIVLPNYFSKYAFGGITSALELAREISRHYTVVRFLSLAPLGGWEDMFDFNAYVQGGKQSVSVESLSNGDALPCHQREIFFCTYWATVRLWHTYAQTLTARNLPVPDFYYFIQDFEPGFYPFGARHSMALETYTYGEQTRALFNSAELACFFSRRGLRFKKMHTLLPSLHPLMRARLQQQGHILPPKPRHKTTIVVYGRPQTPRNCFEAVMSGLYMHFSKQPREKLGDVEIISAGQPHDDIQLVPGVRVQSVGKLDMEDYISLLEQAHVGISLMASPHPSYPPLEMAVFGLRVLTNAYECKDLSRAHPCIRSLPGPEPAALAQALEETLEELGRSGIPAQEARLAANMSPLPWRENVRKLRIERISAP